MRERDCCGFRGVRNLAGAMGFEPTISCVTGRCVKPGYTTPPLGGTPAIKESTALSQLCQGNTGNGVEPPIEAVRYEAEVTDATG